MKIRIKKRRANSESNKVLYILAALVVAIIALALVIRPGESKNNFVEEDKTQSGKAGAINTGIYESETVSLKLPGGVEDISGYFNGTVDSFVITVKGGGRAEYQSAPLSGATTPRELAKSYGGAQTKVDGNPAAILAGLGPEVTVIGTVNEIYRFELRVQAASKKKAKELALELAERIGPGKR